MKPVSELVEKLSSSLGKNIFEEQLNQILSHPNVVNDDFCDLLLSIDMSDDFQRTVWNYMDLEKLNNNQIQGLYVLSDIAIELKKKLIEYILLNTQDEKTLILILGSIVRSYVSRAANRILELRKIKTKENLLIVAKHAYHPALRQAAREHPLLEDNFNALEVCEIMREKKRV